MVLIQEIITNRIFNLFAYIVRVKNKNFREKKVLFGDGKVGICTLTSHADVNKLIFCLMSFFYWSDVFLPVYVVDDGTLTQKDTRKLEKLFWVTIEPLQKIEKRVKKILSPYMFLQKFYFDKKASFVRHKLGVFLTHPFIKYMYIDSDILFLQTPKEILQWIKGSSKKSMYTAHLPYSLDLLDTYNPLVHAHRLLLFEKFGTKVDPTFNSGLLCIGDRKNVDLRKMNTVARFLYDNFYAHSYLAEETISAFMVKSEFSKLSPRKYTNAWCNEQLVENKKNNPISTHYVYQAKAQYKLDAMKLALQKKYFAE